MKKIIAVITTLIGMWLGGVHADNTLSTSTQASFFQTHGFVFFFASSCPYCHQFAPVLSRVALSIHARVLPLSFDNKPLPEFKDFLPATPDWTTAAFKNEAIHYPALFIANPKTLVLYPVSIGALNDIELGTRIDALIPKIMAYEKGSTPS